MMKNQRRALYHLSDKVYQDCSGCMENLLFFFAYCLLQASSTGVWEMVVFFLIACYKLLLRIANYQVWVEVWLHALMFFAMSFSLGINVMCCLHVSFGCKVYCTTKFGQA